MRKILAAGLLAAVSLVPAAASAAPVHTFEFKLTVGSVFKVEPEICTWDVEFPAWGCGGAKVGDVWTGRFQIGADPRTLADGGYSFPFITMRITTEAVVWDHCAMYSGSPACYENGKNVLAGYRDLVIGGFSGESTGFWIQGGRIIGIAGGFYSGSDVLSLDFDSDYHYPGAGRFFASGDSAYVGEIRGTYSVAEVPEPSSLALLGVGLLGVLGVRRRRG